MPFLLVKTNVPLDHTMSSAIMHQATIVISQATGKPKNYIMVNVCGGESLMFGDKTAKCSDQNNADLYQKQMAGKALCLPQTIGSTTGGLVLYCACAMDRQPACLLFANPIDSLAAAGAILADVWLDGASMPVIDSLGEEFLAYVEDGMQITVSDDGLVTVE